MEWSSGWNKELNILGGFVKGTINGKDQSAPGCCSMQLAYNNAPNICISLLYPCLVSQWCTLIFKISIKVIIVIVIACSQIKQVADVLHMYYIVEHM